MTDIEIPFVKDRDWKYRFWEIFPGATSWTVLILPFVLSFINPTLTALLVLAYLLIWFIKGIALSIRVMQGWNMLNRQQKLEWPELLGDLEAGQIRHERRHYPKWHVRNVGRLAETPLYCKPSEVMHAIIIATYNETRDTLEPTIRSVLNSAYDMKKVILILAFEERGSSVEQ